MTPNLGKNKQKNGNVLVTGGVGYIGATVCSALLDAGWTPIILDNLSQGRKEFADGRIFYHGDIADRSILKKIIESLFVPGTLRKCLWSHSLCGFDSCARKR